MREPVVLVPHEHPTHWQKRMWLHVLIDDSDIDNDLQRSLAPNGVSRNREPAPYAGFRFHGVLPSQSRLAFGAPRLAPPK